jgi:hypothetical protein
MHSNRTNFLVLSLLSITTVFCGCVKNRPLMDDPDENLKDLVSVHELTAKTCEFKTKQVRQRDFSSHAQNVSIETSGRHGIRNLDIVDFETDCPYLPSNLKNIELHALPNTKIPVRFEVNPSMVILYKVVEKSQLSHFEFPYAIKEGERYKVPIGGFEVSGFFNVERKRNADNRKTNVRHKVSVAANNFGEAAYLTFNRDGFKNFSRLAKQDVYPKEYFDGEWYYAATVISVRHNSGVHPGRLIEEDSARKRASRVRFRVESENLVVENQNIDDRLRDNQHSLNMNSTLQIPIENVDFRARPEGSSISLEEEKIPTQQPTDARYIELKLKKSKIVDLDFESSASAFFDFFERKIDRSSVLNELVIRDDYFSFVLENREHDEVVRYAFKRVNAHDEPLIHPYTPRIAFKTDMDQFGYFTVRKDQIVDSRLRTQENVDSNTYIERFHPERDIVYHFSKKTPKDKWIRDIGREAVAIWDQALSKAGLKIHMRLDEDEDVDLGDLRYNVLNFVGDLTGGLIGYGPVIADSKTGEVLSGSANLFIENFKQTNTGLMRFYVSEKIGQRFRVNEPGNLTQPLTHMNSVFEALMAGEWMRGPDKTRGFMPLFRWSMGGTSPYEPTPLLTDEEIRAKTRGRWNSAKDLIATFTDEVESGKMTQTLSQLMDQSSRPRSTWALDKFIETAPQCQGLRDLIDKYVASGVPSTQEFLTAAEPCVIPYTQFEGLGATVHEIGHNLGLTHNFMGSKDIDNFISADEYKLGLIDIPGELVTPRSSSIMDYFGGEAGFQVYPGPYDMAAIRFGYMDRVEDASGTMLKLDSSRELNRQSFATQPRPFLYCSDIHRYLHAKVFCKAHDVGSTATEGAVSRVTELYRSLASIYRYQTAYELWDPNSASPYWIEALYDLKTYYDHWRLLVAQEVGDRKQYLQGVSEDEYAQIVQRMLNSPRKAEVEDFLKARNVIVQSLIDLVFLPNRYCVALNETGDKSFLELSLIRKELQRLSVYGRVDSCRHPAVIHHLTEQKLKLTDEVGFDLEAGSYEVSPIAGNLAYDFMGTIPIRLNAAAFLTVHGTRSGENALQDFFPSMMDEPDIRRLMTDLWRYRVLKGNFVSVQAKHVDEYAQPRLLNVNDMIARTNNDDGKPELRLNYAAESDLLRVLSSQIAMAHYVPGDVAETVRRIRTFQVSVYPTSEFNVYRSGFPYSLELDKHTLGVAESPQNSIAAQIILNLNQIDTQKAAVSMTPEAFVQSADALVAALERRKLLPPENQPTNYDFYRLNRALELNLMAAQSTGQTENQAVIELLFNREKSVAKEIVKQMENALAMQGLNPQVLTLALKSREVFDNAMKTLNVPDEDDDAKAPSASLRERTADLLVEQVQNKKMTLEEAYTLSKKMNPDQATLDVITDGALDLLVEAVQDEKITLEQGRMIARRILRDANERNKPKPGEKEPSVPFIPSDKTRLDALRKAFVILDQQAMPAEYAGGPGQFPNAANLHKLAEIRAHKIRSRRSEMSRTMGEYEAHSNLLRKILMDFVQVSL